MAGGISRAGGAKDATAGFGKPSRAAADMGDMQDERPVLVQVVDPARPRNAAELAAVLDGGEDDLEIGCDADATLAVAARVEQAADALGEVELTMRARLLRADMAGRKGQPTAVRLLWEVNRWAAAHQCRPLLARSHLLLSRAYANLGDMAVRLEHAVYAVESLAPDAPPHTRAFHLMKLADALKWNGSIDAARQRYAQAEKLAAVSDPPELLMMVLNNRAYAEYMFDEPQRAWEAIERLLSVAADSGTELDSGYIDTIARTQIALGRHAEAEQTIQAGILDYHVRGYEVAADRAEQLLTLALAQRCMGATDRAQQSLDECRALCAEAELAGVAVRVKQEQAELHAATRDFRAAFEAHKAFVVAAEELRSAQREAQARTRQAMFETAEAREDAERFREQARRDPLTGLHNRRYVDEKLPELIRDAADTGAPLTIAMVDIDHFKRINDTRSHDVGDQVLIVVADLLLRTGVDHGFAARLGGEEFLVVLPGTSQVDADRHLNHVRTTIRAHDWQPVTQDLPVTVSIGAVTATSADASQSTLLAEADRHLYAAKHAGRDRVVAGPHPARRRRYRDAPDDG